MSNEAAALVVSVTSFGVKETTVDLDKLAESSDKLVDAQRRVVESTDKAAEAQGAVTVATKKWTEAQELDYQATVKKQNAQLKNNEVAIAARVEIEKIAQSTIRSMQAELDMLGKTRAEMDIYKASVEGIRGASLAQITAIGKQIEAFHAEEIAMKAVKAATESSTAASEKFIASLKMQADTAGMTRKELLSYQAAQLGVGDKAAPMIAGIKETGSHMDGFSFKTAGAKRELLVLAHELSQGNYSRFGGSMMVLGERTGAASLLFSAMGLAVVGVAGSLGLLGYAIIKGAHEHKLMDDALIMTGNYAGVTADALDKLAHSAAASGGSLGSAKKAVTELAASGKFTGDQIGLITRAAVDMERATGQSVDKTIKQFEKLAVESTGHSSRMSTAISDALLKENEQFHFLTVTIYDQIRAFEKDGDQKAASGLAITTLADVTKTRAAEMMKNIGSLEGAWIKVKNAIGGAISAAGDIGKPSTAQTELDKITEKINARAGRRNGGFVLYDDPDAGPRTSRTERTDALAKQASLQALVNAQNKAAADQSKKDIAISESLASAKQIDNMLLRVQKKSVSELTQALETYHAELDRLRVTDPANERLVPATVTQAEADIKRAHSTREKGLDDRKKQLQDELTLEKTELDRAASLYAEREQMLSAYHGKLGLSDDDFYAGSKVARDAYMAAEAVSYGKEQALIAGFAVKTKAEAAERQKMLDALLRAHMLFQDKMTKATGGDALTVTLDQHKYYAAIATEGDKALKSLDASIAKQKEHNVEIGKTKEQVELVRKAREDGAASELQDQVDAYKEMFDNARVMDLLSDNEIKNYELKLSYIERELAKKKELAGLLAVGAEREAAAAVETQQLKFLENVDKTAQSVFVSVAENGSNAFKKIGKTLQASILDVLYQLTVKQWIVNIAGSITGASADTMAIAGGKGLSGAVGSASGLLSGASNASSLYSTVSSLASVGTQVAAGSMSLANAMGTIGANTTGTGLSGLLATNGAYGTLATGSSITAAQSAMAVNAAALPGEGVALAAGTAETAAAGGAGVTGALAAIGPVGWAAIAAAAALAIFGGDIFGGKRTNGTGGIEGSVGAGGFTGNRFQNYTEDGGWFGSDSSGKDTSGLDAATQKALTTSYTAITTAATGAATALGLSSASITDYSQSISVDMGGDAKANQAAIAKMFAGIADNIAASLVPSISLLQKVGESASAALDRLSASLTGGNAIMALLHLQLFNISVAGASAASNLADAFGGMANLASASKSYYDTYYTASQRAGDSIAGITTALQAMNIAVPQSKEAFKALVSGLNVNTDAGAAAYATLIKLAPAFATATDEVTKIASENAVKMLATFTTGGFKNIPVVLGDANLSAAMLSDQIAALTKNSDAAIIDFGALSSALAAVDTETFVHAVVLVFANLATRIKTTVDGINAERIAVQNAALSIVGPAVMTKDDITSAISGVKIGMTPGNMALVTAQTQLAAADQFVSMQAAQVAAIRASAPDRTGLDATAGVLGQATTAATAASGQVDYYRTVEGGKFGGSVDQAFNSQDDNGTPNPSGERNAQNVVRAYQAAMAVQSQAQDAYNVQVAKFAVLTGGITTQTAQAQAKLTDATTAQATAVTAARAAQVAYIASLQTFSQSAAQSLSQLTTLRAETVKYYDAQKALAGLMATSAVSLRAAITTTQGSQLTAKQSLAQQQSTFAQNVNGAMSTTGTAQIGYADKLTAALPALSTALMDVSVTRQDWVLATAKLMAQGEAVAKQLDVGAKQDYAADSLVMLGNIDTALAALQASTKSVQDIVADAVTAGSDKTAAGLRAVIAAITGANIPAFASGGDFAGGVRLVGEDGPELEATGPSRIYSANQTKNMMANNDDGSSMSQLFAALTEEISSLRIEAQATAVSNAKISRLLTRLAPAGDALQTRVIV